jgi:imidazolonepropionase-like amidohydrolase
VGTVPGPRATTAGRGHAVVGRVWPGGDSDPVDDAVVLLDATGRIAAMGPRPQIEIPLDVRRTGDELTWVGPGVIDAHVHLAFGTPEAVLAGGVTSVRDLGAPPAAAAGWRTTGSPPPGSPHVAVAGPLLTAPGGYPSKGWGRDGFATFARDATSAQEMVRALAPSVDVIKVALEPAAGPVPSDDVVRAIVAAAHECGLAVTAHALALDMVRRALHCGVDELAHMPVEPLPVEIVEAIVAADVLVASTIQTFVDGDPAAGAHARANAAALLAAGARICYGTDLGNAGTTPGVDPRELEHLAAAGLGRMGALRAATAGAARAAGIKGSPGALRVGVAPDMVVLAGDPLDDPLHWTRPLAVFVSGRVAAGSVAG